MLPARTFIILKAKRGTRFLNNAPQNMQSQIFHAHARHPERSEGPHEGGSAAPRAMLRVAPKAHQFSIELAAGRVRPLADKGLLDPPQRW
jgi:hypothetical protein